MKSRLLMSKNGAPPRRVGATNDDHSLATADPQVLGTDLNCSERPTKDSTQAPADVAWRP
jgi:hypothetical protein